jgi:hypothetical protein
MTAATQDGELVERPGGAGSIPFLLGGIRGSIGATRFPQTGVGARSTNGSNTTSNA